MPWNTQVRLIADSSLKTQGLAGEKLAHDIHESEKTMSIEDEELSNKVILEVGSGRGDMTRTLVNLLAGMPTAQLIVTDISDTFFHQLRAEFQGKNVQTTFICTGAQELKGVANHSVDFLVCNYALCAVNSQAGLAALA